MIKRRKDGGFTLIELMIVIAVIGILAVVLVPKMSGVKDTAKATGVVTNAKSVEAYVVANIDKWASKGYKLDDFSNATTGILNKAFVINPDTNKRLINPYDDTAVLQVVTTEPNTTTASRGVVYVYFKLISGGTQSIDYSEGITIYAVNDAKEEVYENKVSLN